MTKTSHIPTLPPSKTPRSSNQSHPPAQGFCTRSVQNQCKMTPDLTRSWPSPYQ
ncbi:hypothetical protein L210DRAFT_3423238 [Boletus edulis BED1]|uniref:Uncharacterized protein n=1 Tax=Boletus edulis BED1 TaxID=1328754 RepID=A0AAD4BE43_BOLED|nr:hypothetical protein L210DRAFT_3423237 [Boletus edulis BED1]KAF8422598.1 hypothetical protein L210DRAFT_3423238 [Boletus edulis BED1]